MQNYLIWRLVLDRISSLSQRFKEARVSYRKVSVSFAHRAVHALSSPGSEKRLLPNRSQQSRRLGLSKNKCDQRRDQAG